MAKRALSKISESQRDDAEARLRIKKELLATFDFRTVSQVMGFLGWKVYGRVPTPGQLLCEAEGLIESILTEPGVDVAHGFGLEARLRDGVIELLFVVDKTHLCHSNLDDESGGVRRVMQRSFEDELSAEH